MNTRMKEKYFEGDGYCRSCDSLVDRLIVEQEKVKKLREALGKIYRANESKNNGTVMGEAVLCKYFADMSKIVLDETK